MPWPVMRANRNSVTRPPKTTGPSSVSNVLETFEPTSLVGSEGNAPARLPNSCSDSSARGWASALLGYTAAAPQSLHELQAANWLMYGADHE